MRKKKMIKMKKKDKIEIKIDKRKYNNEKVTKKKHVAYF